MAGGVGSTVPHDAALQSLVLWVITSDSRGFVRYGTRGLCLREVDVGMPGTAGVFSGILFFLFVAGLCGQRWADVTSMSCLEDDSLFHSFF